MNLPKTGSEALEAVATRRRQLSNDDRLSWLMIPLQAFPACDDEQIRETASVGYGRIVGLVHAASGRSPDELARFLADGTHHQILTAMHVTTRHERPGWVRLLEPSRRETPSTEPRPQHRGGP